MLFECFLLSFPVNSYYFHNHRILSSSCCDEFITYYSGIKALIGTLPDALPDLSNGTPLRSAFKCGREKLNSMLVDTEEKRAYASRRWDEIRGAAKAHTAMTFARVGIDYSDAEDFNDFRRMHPRLLISGKKTRMNKSQSSFQFITPLH